MTHSRIATQSLYDYLLTVDYHFHWYTWLFNYVITGGSITHHLSHAQRSCQDPFQAFRCASVGCKATISKEEASCVECGHAVDAASYADITRKLFHIIDQAEERAEEGVSNVSWKLACNATAGLNMRFAGRQFASGSCRHDAPRRTVLCRMPFSNDQAWATILC